jgi:hypothetical protein
MVILFFYIDHKVSVFRKTLQTYLDYGYVNAKIVVNFFDIPKYVFG